MSRTLIAILVVTNLATGYQLYVTHHRYEAATSNQTTSHERDTYGKACVDWFKEDAVKAGQENAAFQLARSWRKHGQMVFEIVADWNQTEFASDDTLCLADKQSGILTKVATSERERWMFYE